MVWWIQMITYVVVSWKYTNWGWILVGGPSGGWAGGVIQMCNYHAANFLPFPTDSSLQPWLIQSTFVWQYRQFGALVHVVLLKTSLVPWLISSSAEKEPEYEANWKPSYDNVNLSLRLAMAQWHKYTPCNYMPVLSRSFTVSLTSSASENTTFNSTVFSVHSGTLILFRHSGHTGWYIVQWQGDNTGTLIDRHSRTLATVQLLFSELLAGALE